MYTIVYAHYNVICHSDPAKREKNLRKILRPPRRTQDDKKKILLILRKSSTFEPMKFELRDIELHVFLGTTEKEQIAQQRVLATISFEYDTRKAEVSDDLEDTIDYFELQKFIKNFPGTRRFHLLEALHRELREAIENYFPEIRNLKLQLEKFPFESGSVVIS